jgi:broad specificity phosphatase PhoE
MKEQYPSWWEENQQDSYAARFPEGENFYDLVSRVKEGLEEISHKYNKNQNIGIVTHGGVITAIIADILGITQEKRDRLTIDNCGITVISWGGSFPKIISVNS